MQSQAQCQGLATQFPVPLLYYAEPQRGISEARNTAVNAARERAADLQQALEVCLRRFKRRSAKRALREYLSIWWQNRRA
jgi:uncharacterized protein YggE